MATVFIPSLLQELTGGMERVEVHGETVRQIVNNLDEMHPGIRGRLVEGYKMRPNISVAIDGEVSALGLLDKVGENSEVHFIPAIGGGGEVQVLGGEAW